MRLLIPVAVVVTSLVTASGQCVARCAAEPCHETAPVPAQANLPTTPPCHQHQSKQQAPQPKPCQLSFQSAVSSPEIAKTEIAPNGVVFGLPVSRQPLLVASAEAVMAHSASPPLLPSIQSPDVL